MKNDLIVVGGGPAGLMAAKTAAEDGLKVILIERKKDVSVINRSCLQILYVKGISHLASGKTYMEPVTVDVGQDSDRFNFLGPGFSVDYRGPLRPYLNWIQISPSGHSVHRFKPNDSIWGFNYSKEHFLAGLFRMVEMSGAKLVMEASAIAAEETKTGVRVVVRHERTGSQETLEAYNVIAAEGVMSRVSQSLGMEKVRRALSGNYAKGIWYIVEGAGNALPDSALLTYTIPSFYQRNIIIGMMTENRNSITAGTVPFDQLAKQPVLSPVLSSAKVVKKLHFTNMVRTAIQAPAQGCVIIAGDSAAPAETWIQGAVACGYQAAKAVRKERNGECGFDRYNRWWKDAFAFNTPDYFKVISESYALNRICSDEDLDYIFCLLKDMVGVPAFIVDKKLPFIRKERPVLYEKLLGMKDKSMWDKNKKQL